MMTMMMNTPTRFKAGGQGGKCWDESRRAWSSLYHRRTWLLKLCRMTVSCSLTLSLPASPRDRTSACATSMNSAWYRFMIGHAIPEGMGTPRCAGPAEGGSELWLPSPAAAAGAEAEEAAAGAAAAVAGGCRDDLGGILNLSFCRIGLDFQGSSLMRQQQQRCPDGGGGAARQQQKRCPDGGGGVCHRGSAAAAV
jgi:hypothetical protein